MSDELGVKSDPAFDTRADLGTLLQAQKTELVSQLAGAMANQFNNLMMGITSCAELELKQASPTQKRSLEQILNHAARATSLIQKLLAFSRRQSPAPRKLALNPIVEEISKLLKPLAGEEIQVSVKLDPAAGSILADPVEIEQLVLSLGLNARDAMAQGGTLSVTTELVNLDSQNFGAGEVAAPGSYAMLGMHYAGNGDPASHAASRSVGTQELRITQAIAAARGIVKERRGLLRVSSRPGHGTTFRIYFPALGSAMVQVDVQPVVTNTAPSTKTVLIVEDDDAVRNPAAEFLKMEGFKVLQATNGAEALRIVEDSRSRVDLLVTDIVMAGMSGNEVAATLLKTHPGLRVLYMSGDADKAANVAKSGAAAKSSVLQKPFRLNKLNDKIRELLDQ